MDLQTYIADPRRKEALATRLGMSHGYLWQIAVGWTPKGRRPKRPSAELAVRIERATREIGPEPVLRETLRPDIFGREVA